MCALRPVQHEESLATASLLGADPFLSTADTVAGGGDKEAVAEAEPRGRTSWGSQLDLAVAARPMEEVLELDYKDDDEDTSGILLSDDGEGEDEIFVLSYQAAKPDTATALWDERGSTPASLAPSMDMQNVCKRAASGLNIPWYDVVMETTRLRYEGKKLPQATRAAK